MNQQLAISAVSSTLTIIIFVAAAIGIIKTLQILYSIWKFNKARKVLNKNLDAKIVAFDKNGIPTIIKIKEGKAEKWMYL
jgi:DNA polymerase III delta prime subunit